MIPMPLQRSLTMLFGNCSEGSWMQHSSLRVRAVLLEFLKFRVLAAQQTFFSDETPEHRRAWLARVHPQALVLSDQQLDEVWNQAQLLYADH